MASQEEVRVAYAGDRPIAVSVLRFLREQGVRPVALAVADPSTASHADQLRDMCSYLPEERVAVGSGIASPEFCDLLHNERIDYLLCIHFQTLVPKRVLEIPRECALNLHPGLLPYNRGFHTPTWAIRDGTPYGATLHVMTEKLDAGDIVAQKPVVINPEDTADSLYQRVLGAELELFKESWPSLRDRKYERRGQPTDVGTAHSKKDLASIQRIAIDNPVPPLKLIDQLRALTTNRVEEAAYFELDGKRYRVQVKIVPDDKG